MADEQPKTMLSSREGKVMTGGGILAAATLLLDKLGGDGAVDLSDTQTNIVLIGAIVLGAAYIISRGLAKEEKR